MYSSNGGIIVAHAGGPDKLALINRGVCCGIRHIYTRAPPTANPMSSRQCIEGCIIFDGCCIIV